MRLLKGLASAAAAGSLLLLGACTTPSDTHHHGPRQTMRDADMPAESRDCPYDTASHDMNRPHDTGRMLTAAHPGCRDQQADTQAPPTETPNPPAEPQSQPQ